MNKDHIPYGRQEITQEEIDAVVKVLKSDFLTQGPRVPEFEKQLKSYTGAKHALAVNSATSALHIACMALELGPGDWLWTSPITFVASANCGLYCGANIDFVDIDPKTYNLCPLALEKKLKQAQAEQKLPKVLVAVHLTGQPCDMKAISKLARQYGFSIIEDASHAIGARYDGEPIGGCKYSDICVFSFHPVKIITTAEGGAALTNSKTLRKKMELHRSHGVTRDPVQMTHQPDGPWYYQQIELGYNYRMSEIHAALGLKQLAKLDNFVAARHALVKRYNESLGSLPVDKPFQASLSYSSWHLYIILLKNDDPAFHLEVFNKLRVQEIGVNLHFIPVHTQPFYQQFGFKSGDFPVAENYYRRAISLPLFHSMTELQQDRVIQALKVALK
ncbi:UDP-4-amino-4,6-dideoxy-N-acetyl-beta-L-altrosamine transaminase [Dongshaea marina]|uniref:UDP-4-amino-4, 6-dideoxy-N-acetyl-beta-L-altrosamine transaminase n=1 Tax=Dongshaea marina TaxID=2047966 RepID=UPI000D3E7161|nr:UDP-4-amino-4,6-dideoxy-N-acetyl-beta-L-altrosamine transaminase [Dongshaea marina]